MAGKKKAGKNVLENITPEDSLAILKILSEDKAIAQRIEKTAMERLSAVDAGKVASDVFSSLDGVEDEDIWQRSGRTEFGYVDPGEAASEIFEENLEPFLEEAKKLQKLSLHEEAKKYFMGIAKGLYRFEQESCSGLAEYIDGEVQESFAYAFGEWKKGQKNKGDINEVEAFARENFPEWDK